MKLKINTIWSPDLNPPSEGLPSDLIDFDVLMQVSLGESGKPGEAVFSFSITSPSQLSCVEPNRFISHVLVLDTFSWQTIRTRLEKLLRQTESCKSWDDVIKKLSGCIKYLDEW